VRQYSIDRVEVSWAGLDLTEGIAAGTSIVEARTSPSFSIKPTGYGKVVRVFNPDRSGQITITMDQESQIHQALRGIAILDALSRGSVFPLIIHDASTGETFQYTNAFLMTEPDESRGTESATFPWVWMFERVDKVPQPGNANVVPQPV
jgi:hypothetical protein